MATTNQSSTIKVVTIPGTGVHSLGKTLSGSVNVMLEGAVTGTLGYYTSSGTFAPYADGTVAAASSTVVDCGSGVSLGINATGAGTVKVAGI